MILKEMLKK